MRLATRQIPTRLSTGGYILHAGWEKWHGNEAQAAAVHGMAAGAFPVLAEVPAARFLRLLAAAELGLGAALLLPVVPAAAAGAALTGFAGGLLGMYLRTPALHKPGSVWPTPAGTGVSKDVWMFGIGLALLAEHRDSDR